MNHVRFVRLPMELIVDTKSVKLIFGAQQWQSRIFRRVAQAESYHGASVRNGDVE